MCNVSIIIPIYNGEKYLNKCLDSTCNQTLKNIEIICINDGSTDNTPNILKKYSSKYKQIKVISTENNGQGSARNKALNIAKGEYVGFVDADDWIELNTFELLYNKAKSNNLDLLFFQMINYINNTGKLIETELYNHECFKVNHLIGENIIFNQEATKNFLFEIPVCPVSKLYKKEFLDSNNIRFSEGMFFEDNDFFYKTYFKCERAGFYQKQFYYRRRHNDSVTQTFDKTKFDIIKATNNVLDVFLDNDYDNYKTDVINHTFSMITEWFEKSPLELKQEFYDLIKTEFKGFNELKTDFEDNLKKDFLSKYKIMIKHEFYLDFLSEHKLLTTDYEITDNNNTYVLGSEEYFKYKNNLSQNNYKVSVIIPIYNNEKIIHNTLFSIENQTLGIENIEVIMVNDCSTDNTENVINEYANSNDNFKAIHIKNGTGSPGTPRNIGLKEASSDYVIFLDHDDFFEKDALELLYNSMKDTEYDFVYGTYASIDHGIPTKIVYPREMHGHFNGLSENERSIAFPPPSIWTKLFKKDFLINNNILFPTILGEDAIFISKALIKAKKVNYLWDQLICYHCLNEESYTNNISYKYLNEGFVSEEYMYKFYNTHENKNLYKIRGEGIFDFYLNQFSKCKLSKDEILKIFPQLYEFVYRLHQLGLTPHTSERNVILYNHILKKDINTLLEFKGYKQNENKLKLFIKKFAKKILK